MTILCLYLSLVPWSLKTQVLPLSPASAWVWPFRMAKRLLQALEHHVCCIWGIPISAWVIYLRTKMWNQSSCGKRRGYTPPVCQCIIHWYLFIRSMTNTASALAALTKWWLHTLAASQAGVTGMTRNYHGFGCNLDTPAIKFPINEKVRLFRTLKYFKNHPNPLGLFWPTTHQHHQKQKQNQQRRRAAGLSYTPEN